MKKREPVRTVTLPGLCDDAPASWASQVEIYIQFTLVPINDLQDRCIIFS